MRVGPPRVQDNPIAETEANRPFIWLNPQAVPERPVERSRDRPGQDRSKGMSVVGVTLPLYSNKWFFGSRLLPLMSRPVVFRGPMKRGALSRSSSLDLLARSRVGCPRVGDT